MINLSNINNYIKKTYKTKCFTMNRNDLLKITPLLQDDYGGRNDCTLTSITTIGNHVLNYEIDPETIYEVVERNATKFLYNEKTGTFPLFITDIIKNSFGILGINFKKVFGRYFKGVCYNFERVNKWIRETRMPVILNLWDDGNNYYHNHSVLIIGTFEYLVKNKKVNFFAVYDNWSKEIRFIDYKKLSFISSVNYIS